MPTPPFPQRAHRPLLTCVHRVEEVHSPVIPSPLTHPAAVHPQQAAEGGQTVGQHSAGGRRTQGSIKQQHLARQQQHQQPPGYSKKGLQTAVTAAAAAGGGC
jgi:hypothetical protein